MVRKRRNGDETKFRGDAGVLNDREDAPYTRSAVAVESVVIRTVRVRIVLRDDTLKRIKRRIIMRRFAVKREITPAAVCAFCFEMFVVSHLFSSCKGIVERSINKVLEEHGKVKQQEENNYRRGKRRV